MLPEEKKALKEKLEEKGVTWEKASEELKINADVLRLYLSQPSGLVPKRITDALEKLVA